MPGYEWNKAYRKVGIILEPGIVRVLNDHELKAEFGRGGRKAAYGIAAYAKEQYRKNYSKELKISDRSLACEIYWHYFIIDRAQWIEKHFFKTRLTRWLVVHMDVIDCGERAVDNNRFLWTFLAIFF